MNGAMNTRMERKNITMFIAGALAFALLSLTGCAVSHEAADGPDEHKTIGAVHTLETSQQRLYRSAADDPEVRSMRLAPTISQELAKLTGVESAYVVLTDSAGYAAVKLEGQGGLSNGKHAGKAEPPSGSIGELQEEELAGSGIDWADNGGLTAMMADAIATRMTQLAPHYVRQVYVTGNPSFYSRLQYYSKEEKRKGSWLAYADEFRTMVRMAFPHAQR
jgi:hypothetical protein